MAKDAKFSVRSALSSSLGALFVAVASCVTVSIGGFGALLAYGVVAMIIKNAFDVDLPTPF